MDAATHATLMRRFGYIFEGEGGYPAICEALPLPPHGQPCESTGPPARSRWRPSTRTTATIRSVGFRIGDVAYSSDVVAFRREAFAALEGLDVWIVDALRFIRIPPMPTSTGRWNGSPRSSPTRHPHQHAYRPRLSRAPGQLPEGVEPAFDGLMFHMSLPGLICY